MNNALWVEPIGGILVARVRGEPSFELLAQCQSRVLALLRETAYLARIAFAGDETSTKVFYNDLVAAVTWLKA
jgi:hypothetical protein